MDTGIQSNDAAVSTDLDGFAAGKAIKARSLNKLATAINKLAVPVAGQITGEPNLKEGPQVYIATESKGVWESASSRSGSTIKAKPVRMALYEEDGTNEAILGEEVELTKLWSHSISEGDVGIGANMGSGRISFLPVDAGSGVLVVRNDSGEAIEAGDCLYIKEAVEYEDEPGRFLLKGFAVTEISQWRYVVFAQTPVAQDAIGSFNFIGEFLANVEGTTEKFAYPVGTSLKETKNPTRFRVMAYATDTTMPAQMLVTAPDFHWHQVETAGVLEEVETDQWAYRATEPDGEDVFVCPAPLIDPANWDGLSIGGVTYTKTGDASRSADDGVDSWTETLFPPWSTEIITVVPNDYDETEDKEIRYREAGTGKVWVKDCS